MGSDPDTEPAESEPVSTPARTVVAETDPDQTTAAPPATDAVPESTQPSTTSDPAPEPELVSLGEVVSSRYDENGAIDVDAAVVAALTEFSVLFGPVDGAVAVADDDSIPALGTAALEHVAEVWDSLSLVQQEQIAGHIEALRESATVVYESGPEPLTEGELLAIEADEPQGFAPRMPTNTNVRRIANESYNWLNGQLGARSLNYTVSVVPSSEAVSRRVEAATNFRALEPGSPLENLWSRPCEILIYDRAGLTGDRLRSVVAHELFHCWNYTAGEYTFSAASLTPFYNEGMATWVGEQFARGSSFGEEQLDDFMAFERFPLYRIEYASFGFWSQIAQIKGENYVWGKIPELLRSASSGADFALQSVLSGMEPGQEALIGATAAREPTWSASWDFGGPGVSSASRSFTMQTVIDALPDLIRVGPGEQQLVAFDFAPSEGEPPYIVTQYSTGTSTSRWDGGPDVLLVVDDVSFWCIGGECLCEDGTEPFPAIEPAPGSGEALFVGLFGLANIPSSTAASIISRDAACGEDPEPPLTDNQPGGLVGTWRASNDSLRGMFAAAAGFGSDSGLEVAGVAGEVYMTILADGTALLDYQDVRVIYTGAISNEVTIVGAGGFGWDVDGGRFRVQDTTFSLSATSTLTGDEPLTIDNEVTGDGGTTSFRVGMGTGDQLILFDADGTRGAVFFPTVWIRQNR